MKIFIYRVDYKNIKEKGYYMLPTISDINEIEDIDEISSIGIKFDDTEEIQKFISRFPRYFKLKEEKYSTMDENGKYINKPYTSINFNTFHKDRRMGDINETAIKKRIKFIEKLKEVLNHV